MFVRFATIAVVLAPLWSAGLAVAQGADPGERIARAATELVSRRVPYIERALGGPDGPEQPGIPEAGLDCVTFMEASLLQAAGVDQRPAQEAWLRSTRYDDREPAYCTRLHYISDWVDRNASKGWLTDITRELAHDGGVTLRNHEWTRGWMAVNGQDPAHCLGSPDDKGTLAYIGPDDYDRIASRLRAGDILLFVAKAPGLDTAHLGIVEADGGIAMASSVDHHTVMHEDWRRYARSKASRFAGIRVLRVWQLPAPGSASEPATPAP